MQAVVCSTIPGEEAALKEVVGRLDARHERERGLSGRECDRRAAVLARKSHREESGFTLDVLLWQGVAGSGG